MSGIDQNHFHQFRFTFLAQIRCQHACIRHAVVVFFKFFLLHFIWHNHTLIRFCTLLTNKIIFISSCLHTIFYFLFLFVYFFFIYLLSSFAYDLLTHNINTQTKKNISNIVVETNKKTPEKTCINWYLTKIMANRSPIAVIVHRYHHRTWAVARRWQRRQPLIIEQRPAIVQMVCMDRTLVMPQMGLETITTKRQS